MPAHFLLTALLVLIVLEAACRLLLKISPLGFALESLRTVAGMDQDKGSGEGGPDLETLRREVESAESALRAAREQEIELARRTLAEARLRLEEAEGRAAGPEIP
jgi:hypothetical protein